jgi:hypothetical protein
VLGARAESAAAGPQARASAETLSEPGAPPTRATQSVVSPVAQASPASSALPHAAHVPPVASSAALPPNDGRGVRLRQTKSYSAGVVFVPEGCSGPYDVILHFHGAHSYVRELVEKAAVPAVVAVYNAGNGAERYAQAFQAGGMLTSLLRQVELTASPLCEGSEAKPRRVALTAWSAGYGAVQTLLSHPENRQRVDAVLLADGLHAAFTDRYKRRFAPNALQPFVELGKQALASEKLFAITHSAIVTPGYGSTPECSKLLLSRLGLAPQGDLTRARVGTFSIEGSTGQDKAAHIAQFRNMDESLLKKLRERWSG